MYESTFNQIERDLTDEFLETCRAQYMPTAQVFRRVMREYVSLYMLGPMNDSGARALKHQKKMAQRVEGI